MFELTDTMAFEMEIQPLSEPATEDGSFDQNEAGGWAPSTGGKKEFEFLNLLPLKPSAGTNNQLKFESEISLGKRAFCGRP